MTWAPDGNWDDAPRSRRSRLAQQALSRVFAALRREGVGSRASRQDDVRARALADRILRDFPGHILPLGMVAMALVILLCTMPHVRDALPATGVVAPSRPVTSVVESGLRQRTAAMSDGLDALRAIVAPFSENACEGGAVPCKARDCCSEAPAGHDASAPFVKS
jgi:hypothetical protein